MGKKWTKKEETFLIENYSDLSNIDISIILNKTVNSIEAKSNKLNLKKSKSHKSKMIGLRNKKVGRDLNANTLKKIAKKYKTRGEFQKMDSSAYTSARVKGILNDICSHMIKNQYSIPQLILSEICKLIIDSEILYNTRKIIKPYEIDIFIPKYNLAFEYDGKGWHTSNINDINKNILCEQKNIKLIRIVENNRNYIEDIKSQIINKLDEINKYCNLNIKKYDIININEKFLYDKINEKLIDEDYISNVISKYINYSDFRKNEINLYNKLRKLGLLHKYTKKLKRGKINWDDEKIDKEISKYYYLSDFIKNSSGCYLYVMRHNLKDKLINLIRKR